MNWLYELGASSDRKVIIGVVSVSTVNTLRGDVEFVGEQARQMKAGHAAKGFSLTLFRSFYFFLWRKETKQRETVLAQSSGSLNMTRGGAFPPPDVSFHCNSNHIHLFHFGSRKTL